MRSRRFAGLTLMVSLAVLVGREVDAKDGNADIVVEWNQILQNTTPTTAINATRSYAMLHIAMFDAINAIDTEFAPFRVRLRRGADGSVQAAAAQAAHDVLTALIPAQAATYDAALARQLGDHPSSFVRRGAAVGARVARDILEWRTDDGWNVVGPPYVLPPLPGLWQPTPPNNPVATFATLQSARPMALATTTQFLPAPPPALTSEHYAADFEEVKRLGRVDSMARTAEQTMTARLWAGLAASGTPGATATNLWALWSNIVADLARQRRLSLVETARLFALVTVSIHDGIQGTQTSKFIYGLWRPVTAIQQADVDLNPATDPDPTWLPLITTPPYPSYAGNMSCVGASAATALALAFGTDAIAITATWHQSDGAPAISHHFAGLWEAAEEQAISRVYAGIHFQFDTDAGQDVCRRTAEFVFANYMAPRNRADW
jgi:hypothetical protein